MISHFVHNMVNIEMSNTKTMLQWPVVIWLSHNERLSNTRNVFCCKLRKQNARTHKFNRYYQKLQPRSTGRTSNPNLSTQNTRQNKLLPIKQITTNKATQAGNFCQKYCKLEGNNTKRLNADHTSAEAGTGHNQPVYAMIKVAVHEVTKECHNCQHHINGD